MAATTISSVLDPQLLADSVQAAIAAGIPVMRGTGAGLIVPGLPSSARVNGTTVTVPYFGTLGEFETVDDGTALTPVELTSASQTATVAHGGLSAEITRWAASNGQDPIAEATRQIMVSYERYLDGLLLTQAQRNTATEWDAFTHDISAVGAGTITYDAIVEAIALYGDEADDIACMVVNSKVAKDLRLLKRTDGSPLFVKGETGKLSTVLDIPLVVSNRIAADSTVYTNLLLKKNSLVGWVADVTDGDVATDRNILKNTDVFAFHCYVAAHRYTHLAGRSKPGVVHLKTK